VENAKQQIPTVPQVKQEAQPQVKQEVQPQLQQSLVPKSNIETSKSEPLFRIDDMAIFR